MRTYVCNTLLIMSGNQRAGTVPFGPAEFDDPRQAVKHFIEEEASTLEGCGYEETDSRVCDATTGAQVGRFSRHR